MTNTKIIMQKTNQQTKKSLMLYSFVTNGLSFRFKVTASRLCWEKYREEKVSQQPVYTKPIYCSFCGKLDSSEVKNPPTNEGDSGSIPGSGRSPGEGNGNSLQYSCLKNPTGRGTQWPTIHGGHKEENATEWLSTHTHHNWGDRIVGSRSECAFSWGLKNPWERLLRKVVCCSG